MHPTRLATVLLMTSLAACAAVSETAPPSDAPAAPLPAEAAVPVLLPGPPASVFIGRPVADLEAVLGPPALVRQEGPNEFRRYDVTETCRALAVVVPAGGKVMSLTAGPSVQGAEAPAFEDCTASSVTVGS